jgi:hypothetical protein
MAGFLFRLETSEGIPADPSTLESIVPNWKPGDSICLGHRELRVVGVRDDDADQPPVLIVDDAPNHSQAPPGPYKGAGPASRNSVRLGSSPRAPLARRRPSGFRPVFWPQGQSKPLYSRGGLRGKFSGRNPRY